MSQGGPEALAAEADQPRGALVAVVGPSGAGKDTLIDAARKALTGNPRFIFPRRVVTRPVNPDLEVHESVSDAEFHRAEDEGAYAAVWRSHGNAYGLPVSIVEDVARGHVVVVNVSRAVIDTLRRRVALVHVIHVSARPDVLAERLRARGRESADQIAARIARNNEIGLPTAPITLIDNSGDVNDAISAFIAACHSVARGLNSAESPA